VNYDLFGIFACRNNYCTTRNNNSCTSRIIISVQHAELIYITNRGGYQMATPSEKLAESLEIFRNLQDKQGFLYRHETFIWVHLKKQVLMETFIPLSNL